LTGLADGDVLAAAPSDRLVDGMRVRADDAPPITDAMRVEPAGGTKG